MGTRLIALDSVTSFDAMVAEDGSGTSRVSMERAEGTMMLNLAKKEVAKP